MSANVASTFTLDPFRHGEAVRLFLQTFRLTPQLPTLAYLQQIITAFAHLPYENLSKIIKFNQHGEVEHARLRLPEEVMEDHARLRTGGTCFSLSFLLHAILLQQGFINYPVMGDMRAGQNLHCALMVLLEGVKLLLDPGYLLQRPMPLDSAKPRLYHNEFNGVELRFDLTTQRYNLFTFDRVELKWRYRFADRPTPLEEFLRHWQASFQRNSMNGLCLTRAHAEELIFVRKDFMRITSWQGKRNVKIKHNYHAAIAEAFGLAPEYVEQAEAALRANLARFKAKSQP